MRYIVGTVETATTLFKYVGEEWAWARNMGIPEVTLVD